MCSEQTQRERGGGGGVSFSPVILDLFGMGMMVEHLKHEGTSHSPSDLLKIFVKKVGPAGQHRISDRLM